MGPKKNIRKIEVWIIVLSITVFLIGLFFVAWSSFSSNWFGNTESWLEESERVTAYELEHGCVELSRYGQEVFCGESKKRIEAVDAKYHVTPRYISEPDQVTFSREDYETVVRNATEAVGFILAAADNPATFDPQVQRVMRQMQTINFRVIDVDGQFTNFGSNQKLDEMRSESAVKEHAVLFKEVGGQGYAEVNRETGEVVAMHRTAQAEGDELTEAQIETKVRQFLRHVYPDFPLVEAALQSDLGVKGNRLNNGNYLFRWSDANLALRSDLYFDVTPFLQVGVTASGYIFSYQNTLPLYQNKRALFGKNLPTSLPGWYAHLQTDTGLLLTRDAVLPDVGATEAYAYGELISINIGNFFGDENNLQDWEYVNWMYNDTALVREKKELKVAGLTTLRVEHEAGGSSGGQLTYFIFSDDRYFALSLYPLDDSEYVTEFKNFVQKFAEAI